MCGRYTLTASNKPDLAHLNLDIPDRYNIAPQADVLVKTDRAEFTVMSWSFLARMGQNADESFQCQS